MIPNNFVRLHCIGAVVAALLSAHSTYAACYASALSRDATSISFTLNEPGADVQVVVGSVTNDLGAMTKGRHSTAASGSSVYRVVVISTLPAGYTQTSSDTNTLVNFSRPNGVAVNTHPNSLAFGRIFVANGNTTSTTTGRVQGRGIYALNADQSDALGQGNSALTAGISWFASTSNPYKLSISDDDQLVISGFSNTDANIWETSQNLTSSVTLLTPSGISVPTNHTDFASSAIVKGALSNGTLTVYCVDGQLTNATTLASAWNSICRWNIGAGPLPFNSGPTILNNTGITTTADLGNDMDIGPDGKIYGLVNRSAGTDVNSVFVINPANPSAKVWGSLATFGSPDALRAARAVAISVDGKKLATVHDDNHVSIMTLTNGIPDSSTLTTVTNSPTTTIGRDIAFDIAGNIYTVSSGQQLLRVLSLGGTWAATTSSDGTFSIVPTVILAPSPFYTLYDAGLGFFGGENLILTNTNSLSLTVWSTTDPGLSITNWSVAGALGEQPLNDGTGRSRYFANLNPVVSPTYYIAGVVTSGPYSNTVPIAILTSDGSGNFVFSSTNVAISQGGVLDFPVGPDIVQQPGSRTVIAGKDATFRTIINSFSVAGFQWFSRSAGVLAGGTNAGLALPAVSLNDAGSYYAVVTNQYGSATTTDAVLTVVPPPQISALASNGNLEFSASGVAGDLYFLQSANSLTPPISWVATATNSADANGVVQFNIVTSSSNQFYRILCP